MLQTKRKALTILAIAVFILLLLLLLAFNRGNQPLKPEILEMMIDTPVCTLYLPGKWENQISIEVNETENITVSFIGEIFEGEEMPLFDVVFGEADDQALGMVKAKKGAVYTVGVLLYDPEPGLTDAQLHLFYAMQEDVNYLINRLPLENQEALSVPKSSIAVVQNKREVLYPDVVVNTPYGPITYPGEVAREVYLDIREEEPYTITFCWNQESINIPLYELIFGSGEGSLLGYQEKTGLPVYMKVFDLQNQTELSEEEQNAALAVQESLNDVVASLELQTYGETWIEVETPFGDLYYPMENQKTLRIEKKENGEYTVNFWFVRDNGEELPLFSVIFGGANGIQIGRYTENNGSVIPVNLVAYEPVFDETWNEQEKEQYYIMAEGVNFLLEKMEEMHPFVFE